MVQRAADTNIIEKEGKKSGEKYYCYTDAGGTFTDTFVIDNEGTFWFGKASVLPRTWLMDI